MNEQLESQLKELKPGSPILIVGNFLKTEFEKDEQLSEDFTKNAIKMDKLWAYIVDEARKKAVKGSCCIADAEVFGLAIHYIQDGYKETLAKKEAQAQKKAKAVCKSSDDEDGEYSSYPTIEELQEQAKKREAESKAKKEAEKAKAALEKQEAKRKASGQLSIFDFMNEA